LSSFRPSFRAAVFLVVLIVFTSSLIYFVENSAQPEAFSSIPAAMWWSVVTLTTVGYGDVYPITAIGKILGALIAIIGIGFVALPAGVLAGAFADDLAKQRSGAAPKQCPHCGGALK
jgi:voltage-gated potassium channel